MTGLDVRYEADLLPPVRFPRDHRGQESFRRTPEQEDRWQAMLDQAEVLFGVGAAPDVFATEPLPAESRLWELPNVLLSPHTAGLSLRENERIVALFGENLRRYLAGDELLSRVHPTLLY